MKSLSEFASIWTEIFFPIVKTSKKNLPKQKYYYFEYLRAQMPPAVIYF